MNGVRSIFVKRSLTAASLRKKRGLAVGKILAITNASGLPVAAHVESASPHEVWLVEEAIDSSFTEYAPDKLVGDKAYDSDKVDGQLLVGDVE